MESLMELWDQNDLYELIDDYLIAIGCGVGEDRINGMGEDRFQAIVRNFEEYWDYDACNKMIAHMINTVYDINDN